MSNFDPSSVFNLVGLWDFRAGKELSDTGLDDGVAQNGWLHGDATVSGDQLHTDGKDDYFDVDGETIGSDPDDSPNAGDDDPFDMAVGTIEVQFTQDQHIGSSPDTLVNRGEEADKNSEGYFNIAVTQHGQVQVQHYANGNDECLETSTGFFSPGDLVNVKYSWDEGSGVTLEVENLTTGAVETVSSTQTGLTMDIGDKDDESFTFGAREDDDGSHDRFFDGSIDYVAIYQAEAPTPDGAVDGEATGELMELGYNDANAPTNQGGDVITNDADLIFGNGGDDTIHGEGGDDTIYGDSGDAPAPEREIFRWSDSPLSAHDDDDDDDDDNFTLDTGKAAITFTVLSEEGKADTHFEGTTQNVEDLDPEVGTNSSMESVTNGDNGSAAYRWESNTVLSNVEFRVNDIDGDGRVYIKAFAPDGTETIVELSEAGPGLALSDSDGVPGNDTATSIDDDYTNDNNIEHSVLVNIPGPVVAWELYHEQDGGNNSGVNITDITYDVLGFDPGDPGNDVIHGDEGDDLILGQQGDDTALGGQGDDTLEGGEGNDELSGGEGGDELDGGEGDDLLEGGEGDDTLLGSAGTDTVGGGGGRDTYVGQADETIVVNVDDDGNGTLFQAGDGNTQTLSDVENFVAPEDSPEADEITLTTPVLASEVPTKVQGLTDDSVGQFTAPNGDVIAFGPAEDYKLSDLLTGTSPGGGLLAYGPIGSFTITDGDEDGQVGDISFENFETINFTVEGDAPGPVDGLDNAEDMGPGYMDLQGDQIDGTDGDDDTIFGNGGDDTIDSGEGDDTVDGGAGDDTFVLSDTGSGIDNDAIIGGETDEDGPGDSIDGSDITDDLTVTFSGPEAGTITDGVDSTSFEEIERVETGAGDDTVLGGAGDDHVSTGGGDDSMLGGQGNDTLISGDGFDTVKGEGGDDSLVGGDESDTIEGGDGNDTIEGGRGGDALDGGAGDDLILGGNDSDTILGGDGSDTVDAGEGDNVIDTSGGDPKLDDKNGDGFGFAAYGPFPAAPADPDENDDRDLVIAGSGDDTITTGDDADTILGGAGDNVIDAGIDNDEITTTFGNDFIVGGEGADTIDAGAGDDTIYGGLHPAFPDALNIPDDGSGPFGADPDPENGRDLIHGGAGNDLIYGQDDDDTIYGGGGADTIHGGIDDDYIDGGNVKDVLYGDQGDDTLIGGGGNDSLFGGEGADQLDGGVGNDDIAGGAGADTMTGGDDRDTFTLGAREDAFGDVVDGGTGGTDLDSLDLRGLGRFQIVGETVDADGDSTSGTVNFLDDSNNVEGSMTFTEIENLVICFTPGARIATPRGEVNVEDLRVGDRVITRDDGVQDIHWIGRKKLTGQDLLADPKLRPVLIKKGALGNNLPERDMMVSPNHRMLMANSHTQLLFDEREVLVAAKHLVGQPGIHQIDTLGIEYIHVMFERHEVILGDGAWTESFQPGDHSLNGIDADQREEIFRLFPELAKQTGRRAYTSARQSLKAHEARMLRQTLAAE